ncbi:MAG: sulfur carrier protein ThiS adenylyltransferase ThiF, partial [Phascolarctobacterium sp.]|nr:sulfur carrier protein ThiS adenylyltransferase ThiF [Phascolarctobacterium sp.]
MQEELVKRCGSDAVNKLQQAKVAVVGLGGLGSNIAILFARMGIGHLHLIDFDKVDISNLHRQQYFVEQVGSYKTEALASTLRKINPYVELKASCVKLDEHNLEDLLKDEAIICEALDKAETKAVLVNGALGSFADKVMVTASGMAGLGEGNLIQARRISKNLYVCGDGVSDCNDESLYAARV